MKLGWLTIVGLVLLGAAAMLGWTWRDQARKLSEGQWTAVELDVLRTQVRSIGNRGGLLFVAWTEPASGTRKDGAALIDARDIDSGRYQPGQKIKGWVHPGFWRPEVGDTQPNLAPEQSFLPVAAAACAALGLLALGIAWQTGRLVGGS